MRREPRNMQARFVSDRHELDSNRHSRRSHHRRGGGRHRRHHDHHRRSRRLAATPTTDKAPLMVMHRTLTITKNRSDRSALSTRSIMW